MASVGASHVMQALKDLRLPVYLVDMIKMNTLEKEIEAAQAHVAQLNSQMDAWEDANPHAVHLLPWYEARKAWKKAGRPSPEWYELLWMLQKPEVPIRKMEVSQCLIHNGAYSKQYNAKKKAERLAAKAG